MFVASTKNHDSDTSLIVLEVFIYSPLKPALSSCSWLYYFASILFPPIYNLYIFNLLFFKSFN